MYALPNPGFISLLLLVCWLAGMGKSPLLQAAEPALGNFAFALPLYARGNAAAYRLELPAVVFEHTRNPAAELRVFNAQGQPVPFWLQPMDAPPLPDDAHWRRVEVVGQDNGQRYRVDTGGSFILSQLNIASRMDNSVASVAIYSSRKAEGPWQFERRAELMQLSHEGKSIDDTRVFLGRVEKRYLLLDFGAGSVSFRHTPPVVDIRYQPLELLFLRQGEGPFTLAFGDPQAEAAGYYAEPAVHKPARQFQSTDLVTGELQRQSPKARATTAEDTALDYGRLAFWISITGFVLLMLLVALWLIRDVRRGDQRS